MSESRIREEHTGTRFIHCFLLLKEQIKIFSVLQRKKKKSSEVHVPSHYYSFHVRLGTALEVSPFNNFNPRTEFHSPPATALQTWQAHWTGEERGFYFDKPLQEGID